MLNGCPHNVTVLDTLDVSTVTFTNDRACAYPAHPFTAIVESAHVTEPDVPENEFDPECDSPPKSSADSRSNTENDSACPGPIDTPAAPVAD